MRTAACPDALLVRFFPAASPGSRHESWVVRGNMNLTTLTWEGHVMGTEARLLIVTNDPKAGHEALVRAARDLETTEKTLSTETTLALSAVR